MTGLIKKFKLLKESPTPKADMMTSFFMPAFVIASRTVLFESARNVGDTIGLAKGLSEARGAFNVTITASAASFERLKSAFATSFLLVGVPCRMRKPSLPGRDAGLRTRAVTLWPSRRYIKPLFRLTRFRDVPLAKASSTTRRPVRPLAPMTTICISMVREVLIGFCCLCRR